MRRPTVALVLLGILAALLRRVTRSGSADRDVWTEATTAPDLR